MSEYKGYTKIPLTSAKWENFDAKIIKNTKWVVTEKVHGSCFCFVYDKELNVVKFAKRKDFINETETFLVIKIFYQIYYQKLMLFVILLLKIFKILNLFTYMEDHIQIQIQMKKLNQFKVEYIIHQIYIFMVLIFHT
jgi:hypothetical protein